MAKLRRRGQQVIGTNMTHLGDGAPDSRRPYRPTEWQCALLILLMIHAREEELKEKEPHREVSRARISQNTIRRLFGRSQFSNDFLLEVQENLLTAGWALFCIGPSYYAVVKLDSAHGWNRISSKRIADKLASVALGEFRWEEQQGLLMPERSETAEAEEKEPGEDT